MAQLFLELLCAFMIISWLTCLLTDTLAAAQFNEKAEFGDLRVYGLITNLSIFQFYSYDPTHEQFCLDSTIMANNKRDDFTSDMIEGSSLSTNILHQSQHSYSSQCLTRSLASSCRVMLMGSEQLLQKAVQEEWYIRCFAQCPTCSLEPIE